MPVITFPDPNETNWNVELVAAVTTVNNAVDTQAISKADLSFVVAQIAALQAQIDTQPFRLEYTGTAWPAIPAITFGRDVEAYSLNHPDATAPPAPPAGSNLLWFFGEPV